MKCASFIDDTNGSFPTDVLKCPITQELFQDPVVASGMYPSAVTSVIQSHPPIMAGRAVSERLCSNWGFHGYRVLLYTLSSS